MGGVQEQAPFVPARLGGLWPVRHQRFSFLLVQKRGAFRKPLWDGGERGMVQGWLGQLSSRETPISGRLMPKLEQIQARERPQLLPPAPSTKTSTSEGCAAATAVLL